MGWVWRIRTNECWIGQGLSFSFVLPWFRCIGEPGCIFRCLKASRCFTWNMGEDVWSLFNVSKHD